MMKLTSILANSLVFFAAASLLIGCGVAGGEPFPTYRYRMAVEVDTPEGVRTGSSVIEVETTLSSKYTIPTPGKVNTTIHREAVAIDLKERGVLFATLRSEKDVDWARNIMFLLAPAAPRGVSDPFASRFKDMLGMKGPIELPRFLPDAGLFTGGRPGRPMLVRFGDLSDPTSVARVDADDLSKSFGNGVKLRRITVELTQQPVLTISTTGYRG